MSLKNKRVFVVEDNIGNLSITSVYLRQFGAIVESERWGKQACQRIIEHLPIDVILLDLMFPNNVSGFDVFSQIKQVPELQHIPVVAVSASDPDSAMPKAKAMGFAGYISKPITPWIAKQIAGILDGQQVWIADGGSLFI